MLMLWRLVKFTLVFLFLLFPLMLSGAIILLAVCPFIPKNQLKLPAFCKWFDIVDAWIGRDTSVIKKIYAQGWWARYCYCAWRNPVNYFDYVYMGLKWNGSEVYTKYNPADDDVGDTTNARPGFRHIEVKQGGKEYFEYYWIYQYPFAKHVCFRFRLGHKIGSEDNPPGTVSQWVYVISPWKQYSGR